MDLRQKEAVRSRRNSTTATIAPYSVQRSPRPAKAAIVAPLESSHTDTKSKAHYTVFVRLPFPRNDFQDPPLVDWDAAKDEELWKIISASSGKELNWKEMSLDFQVPLPFLLQQAAWLYERRFESMKAQMKRFGVSGMASPNPQTLQSERSVVAEPGSGGVSMVRTGSRGVSHTVVI